ncbi:hypothetical protein LINGRAHAP2_LOCUS30630 [Linum grandiflorum]
MLRLPRHQVATGRMHRRTRGIGLFEVDRGASYVSSCRKVRRLKYS